MALLERLTAIYAPDDCLTCGREGSLLCPACRPRIPAPKGICFGCYRLAVGVACDHCVRDAGLINISAAADYSGAAKLLVACLKFRGNQSAAKIIANEIAAQYKLPTDAWLVSMPATTSHIRQRGFDQASLIARYLARATNRPYRNALRRSGQHHQLGADREQRLYQLTAHLRVVKDVQGKNIVLIDDVLTTGSSIKAAASALQLAGAPSVSALVFAQAIKKPD